eukprot:GFYU01000642.1.p1 GENE.GFYU01000642.1~~GFYU01000642.1.p1  ORF type:complete len:350 (+),score=96.16 GFYU01000642.1:124-1173(+)
MSGNEDLDNVPLAFGLTVAAGAATTIGAASVYGVKTMNNKALAISLGVSAGVMIYVSFMEIVAVKAVESFAAGAGEEYAQIYTAITFFGGMLLCAGLDKLVHTLSDDGAHHHGPVPFTETRAQIILDDEGKPTGEHAFRQVTSDGIEIEVINEHDTVSAASSEDETNERRNSNADGGFDVEEQASAGEASDVPLGDRKLRKMGAMTAMAISLHNFPEGLATFVSTLADPSLGVAMAFAIALHNIPEGICVSMPLYFATGKKHRAFAYGVLSGLSEPVGALVGWGILMSVFNDIVYGCLFGVVGGMMIYISLRELLPTAHRYDPEDKVVTASLVFGMFAMALSLLLFALP